MRPSIHHIRIQKRLTSSLRSQHSKFLDLVHNRNTSQTNNNHGKISSNQSKYAYEITIDNIHKRNCINGKMMNELVDITDTILNNSSNNDSPTCLILRSTGDFFCAGADFQMVSDHINTSEKGLLMLDFMTSVLNAIRDSKYISLCVVNGPAMGGGAELITSTDFRTIEENAFIQFVQVKLGTSCGWGGASRLLSIVGRNNALKLLAGSIKVIPSYAEQINLVDDVYASNERYAPDQLPLSALTILDPFLKQPYPQTVGDMKKLLTLQNESNNNNISLKSAERDLFSKTWASDNNKEAISKFFNKVPK